MKLRNQKEVDIANLLDKGYSYSQIEASLNVYPAQISRVRNKMVIILSATPTPHGSWILDEEMEMKELEKEARVLQLQFKRK